MIDSKPPITKDDMIRYSWEQDRRITEFVTQVSSGIKALNDNSTLHSAEIKENTAATLQMVVAIKAIARSGFWLFTIVIFALIVLAGAEKALPFIKLIP